MKRREFALLLILTPVVANGAAAGAAKLALLKEFVEAIGAAGDALSKLVVGFRDLALAGRDSYDFVSAEREKERLIEISRATSVLIAHHNEIVVANLDEYVSKRKRTRADWNQVVRLVGQTLIAVQQLLRDVETEDGSFVLEPAFLKLNQALSARESLLTKILAMEPPTEEEEIEILREASAKYKQLIANATQAVSELNSYVKSTAR